MTLVHAPSATYAGLTRSAAHCDLERSFPATP